MTDFRVTDTPMVGLLGYVKEVPPTRRKLVALLLILAKRRVAMVWGGHRIPREWVWLDAEYCSDQLSHYWDMMPPKSRLKDIWAHLHNYLKTKEGPSESPPHANSSSQDGLDPLD